MTEYVYANIFDNIFGMTCRLDSKEQVDVAILDFSKAFDVVPHQRLLR